MAVNTTSSSQLSVRAGDVHPAASNDQLPELHPDVMGVIFSHIGVIFSKCMSISDLRTITALPCVNKYWNQLMINFFEGCDLKHICPELTIMDAKTQQRECADEPRIDNFKIYKAVKKVAPHVEGNAGVTLLTMIKGDTLNKLIEIAAEEGMQVTVPWNVIIEELGDVPVEQTYTILITNNVFIDSRDKYYKEQEILAKEHGCQMPTGQEYVALCVFAKKIFQKCLYGYAKNWYRKNPPTYGRSSTHVQGFPLLVGASVPGCLCVNAYHSVADHSGAGGQWKF